MHRPSDHDDCRAIRVLGRASPPATLEELYRGSPSSGTARNSAFPTGPMQPPIDMNQPAETDPPPRWVAIARSDELGEDAGIERVVEGQLIAVIRHAGRVFAIEALCAHHGGPLAQGRLADGCVTCPWHGWQYNLADGTQTTSGAQLIQSYPAREREGHVEVAMPT